MIAQVQIDFNCSLLLEVLTVVISAGLGSVLMAAQKHRHVVDQTGQEKKRALQESVEDLQVKLETEFQ